MLVYLIIGNSAAGIFAAEAIRQIDQDGQIDILSSEIYPAYARCLTSYFLSGQMPESQMMIRDVNFYRDQRITLQCGETAVQVDPLEKSVLCASGRRFPYDKLLLASGSAPVIPDFPGVGSPGVFGLRTLADAKGILAYAAPGKKAVLVGGGFVALKAAYALLQAGVEVTCLISSGQVLSQMLDKEAADALAQVLISHGMKIRYHSDVAAVIAEPGEPDGKIRAVRLSSGEELPADVLIIGKGVTPNTAFLAGSGIDLAEGVLVDHNLATSIPDIYAAGDVAMGYDLVTGTRRINALWPNATDQGTIAGKNMAGANQSYDGSIAMNSADFFGVSVIAAGWTKSRSCRRLSGGPPASRPRSVPQVGFPRRPPGGLYPDGRDLSGRPAHRPDQGKDPSGRGKGLFGPGNIPPESPLVAAFSKLMFKPALDFPAADI